MSTGRTTQTNTALAATSKLATRASSAHVPRVACYISIISMLYVCTSLRHNRCESYCYERLTHTHTSLYVCRVSLGERLISAIYVCVRVSVREHADTVCVVCLSSVSYCSCLSFWPYRPVECQTSER